MLEKIKNKINEVRSAKKGSLAVKKLVKNEKGSELVEKIMMIAVSVAIGAVVIGVIWGIVNAYSVTSTTNHASDGSSGVIGQ